MLHTHGVAGPSPVVPTNVGHRIEFDTGSIPVRSASVSGVKKAGYGQKEADCDVAAPQDAIWRRRLPCLFFYV